MRALIPNPILTADWRLFDQSENGFFWKSSAGFVVIVSVNVYGDNKRWIHFSVSHRDRIPTWDELVTLKEQFLGTSSKAVQVIPPRDQYVNVCKNCLHLWVCVDEDPLPDFRINGEL